MRDETMCGVSKSSRSDDIPREEGRTALPREESVRAILARAWPALTAAGHRLGEERARGLCDECSAAPLPADLRARLQTLAALLSRASDVSPDEQEARMAGEARALGAALRAHGIAFDDAFRAGQTCYTALLRELAAHLRESDDALVAALGQINLALHRLGADVAIGYHEAAIDAADAAIDTDVSTGANASGGASSSDASDDSGPGRRAFDERFTIEVARSRRTGHPLALILFDIRDTTGPGDTGMGMGATLAPRVRAETRLVDMVARLDDTLVALLLPDTGRGGARRVADRLRQRLTDEQDTRPPGVGAIRAGIAVYPDDGRTPDELLEYADGIVSRVEIGVPDPLH